MRHDGAAAVAPASPSLSVYSRVSVTVRRVSLPSQLNSVSKRLPGWAPAWVGLTFPSRVSYRGGSSPIPPATGPLLAAKIARFPSSSVRCAMECAPGTPAGGEARTA